LGTAFLPYPQAKQIATLAVRYMVAILVRNIDRDYRRAAEDESQIPGKSLSDFARESFARGRAKKKLGPRSIASERRSDPTMPSGGPSPVARQR
jgi:hypothetical protein